jgi:hypothetical protein
MTCCTILTKGSIPVNCKLDDRQLVWGHTSCPKLVPLQAAAAAMFGGCHLAPRTTVHTDGLSPTVVTLTHLLLTHLLLLLLGAVARCCCMLLPHAPRASGLHRSCAVSCQTFS